MEEWPEILPFPQSLRFQEGSQWPNRAACQLGRSSSFSTQSFAVLMGNYA